MFHSRENVLEQIEKLNKYIATRTCIVRNQFTVADIAMWAAIKSKFLICLYFIFHNGAVVSSLSLYLFIYSFPSPQHTIS